MYMYMYIYLYIHICIDRNPRVLVMMEPTIRFHLKLYSQMHRRRGRIGSTPRRRRSALKRLPKMTTPTTAARGGSKMDIYVYIHLCIHV